MTLYAVYNGWQGTDLVYALVEAETPEAARDQARELLAGVANRGHNATPDSYSEALSVEEVTLPQVSDGSPDGTVVLFEVQEEASDR